MAAKKEEMRIKIIKDGPYRVTGGLPLFEQIIEDFEKLINRKAYILLLPYYLVYENPHRFCHSRRIFSG
jgi:hypothetical protein